MNLLSFKKVFAPAVFLMSRLSLLQSFLIVGFLFALLFCVGLFSFVTDVNRNIATALSQQAGLRYVNPTQRLLEDMQQHRGLTGAYLGGYKNFEKELAYKRSEIKRDFSNLERAAVEFETQFKTESELAYVSDIKNEWLELERMIDDHSLTVEVSFEKHTHITQDILLLLAQIGDTSGLTHDAHTDSLYLVDAIINRVPVISENIGQARVAGLTMQVNKIISQSDKQVFLSTSIIANANMQEIQRGMQTAFKGNMRLREQLAVPLEDTSREVDSFLEIVDKRFIRAETNTIERLEYYTTITRLIDHVFMFNDIATASLGNLLQDRVNALQAKRNIGALSFGAIFVLVLYFFVGLYLKSRCGTNGANDTHSASVQG